MFRDKFIHSLSGLTILLIVAMTRNTCLAGFVFAGAHTLSPNQANQVINIFASPSFTGEIAPGFNMNFVIDDGGSAANGVDNNSPRITSINLKPSGGLFSGIPESQSNVFSSQKLFQVTIAPTILSNRPVITSSVLVAQVTLDTTGFASGSWNLDLDGISSVGLPSSDFAGIATTITNGSITITAIPEPSSLSLLLALSLAAFFRYRGRVSSC